ncbi:MAG: segregation/condensation protein A [Betaproteobacteria bacterium]|nr:segregation/condensation protein A [Betaproteobacteria bacterium]
MAELPKDLYIPPEALAIILEAFEGPLDLLLYLIRQQNLNVLDISMADLTRQYLAYVEVMRSHQLELAAEYLLMAALLIEIKSRMLLPRPEKPVDEEDPRAELVRRLLEYEQMKMAARRLDELPVVERDFKVARAWFERVVVEQLPEVHPEDLRMAWLALVARAKANKHHLVAREQLSVRESMSQIMRRLRTGGFAEFSSLFDSSQGVPGLVVSLLGLLELAREGLVKVVQRSVFSPIYVKLSDGTD